MESKKWKNVNELKTEHECEEHWALRRVFLLGNKKKFNKDRLLCLAQVFINVEILGCRYPKETMDLVASLSSDIPEVQSFREKRKNKLKRTFVQASDAAETRAKGLKITKTTNSTTDDHSNLTTESTSTMEKRPEKSSSRITLMDFLKSDSLGVTEFPQSVQSKVPSNSMVPSMAQSFNLESVPSVENPFENIIIMENKQTEGMCAVIIQQSIRLGGYPDDGLYDFSVLPNGSHKCDIIWQKKVICTSGPMPSQKAAKLAAAKELLDIMRKYCYTIQTLERVTGATIEKSSTGSSNGSSTDKGNPMEEPLADNNKGSKMMKLMGWSGGGLGKNGQGIVNPISASQSINRSGLGLENLTIQQRMHKIRNYLDQFIADQSAVDLGFAPDFSKEERAEIHKYIRRKHFLSSKSYGKDNNRYLVVSKKQRPQDILEMLLRVGGSTEKYNLIRPTP